MKRILAYLLTLMMVFQIAGTGLAMAEGTTVTLVYTDAEGNEKTIVLEEKDGYWTDGISAYNNLPDYQIYAYVENGSDIVLTLNVDGDIVVNPGAWTALSVGNQVNAIVDGNVSGGEIQTTNNTSDYHSEETVQEDGTKLYEYSGTLIPSDATVTVTGNVSGNDDGGAILAQGNSVITVDGNVDGRVDAEGGSSVEIGGNVAASDSWAAIQTNADQTEYQGVELHDSEGNYVETISYTSSWTAAESTVNVAGNVTAEKGTGINATNDSFYNEEDGSSTELVNQSTVHVGGDVTAYETGVRASGEAEVSVGGNITAGHEYEYEETKWDEETQSSVPTGNTVTGYSGNGVYAEDNAAVTVGGDVTSKSTGVYTYDQSNVDVTGNVTSENGTGVAAYNNSRYEDGEWVEKDNQSTVHVGGDVTSKETAVYANGQSKVDIAGNVTSENGNGITAYSSSWYEDGEWVEKDNQSTVHVGGDVAAYNSGVYSAGKSVISVDGNITAGHEYEYEETEWDEETQSSVPTGETRTGYSGYGVDARGNTVVTVGGDIVSESTGIDAESYYRGSETETIENEDGTITVIRKYISDPNQAVVTVKGDVTSNHGQGIGASGEATVTVDGSVNADGTGISARGDAVVNVGGDVHSESGEAIYAWTQSLEHTETQQYDAEGNVIPGSWKYEDGETSGAATVIVGGDVTAEKNSAIYMNGDSTIKVQGDVTGGYVFDEEDQGEEEEYQPTARDLAFQAAFEEAFKDTEGGLYDNGAVEIQLDKEGNSGELFVGGTIQANEGNIPVVLNYRTDEPSELEKLPELPEMTVYEIVPDGGEFFAVNVILEKEIEYTYTDEETGEEETAKTNAGMVVKLSEEDHAAMIDALAKSIQYIIKLNNTGNGAINLGANYDAENGVYTAHEGEAVSVTVRPDDGYELSDLTATGNYSLVRNSDGSWTLTVQRGGGVTISAIISQKYIPAPVETTEQEAAPRTEWVHPAIGKTVLFGHYDFDGDETAEDLEWKVLTIYSGGYARLAMMDRVDAIPEDFEETAFDDAEKEAIKAESIDILDSQTAKRVFHDSDAEQVRITMIVKLDAIDY